MRCAGLLVAITTACQAQAFVLGRSWGLRQQSEDVARQQQHPLPFVQQQEKQYPETQKWFNPAPSSHKPRPLTGFVALGDSYSAGIGTGNNGTENDCRQGAHAYPAIIAQDFAASQGGGSGGRGVTSFQFLSCTGATTHELLAGNAESQMDALNGSLPVDFALLSVGGNDLGFFEVMNACIFRFYNFYSGTCETALQHAQERLDGHEFEESLFVVILQLLNKVKWEKKPVG